MQLVSFISLLDNSYLLNRGNDRYILMVTAMIVKYITNKKIILFILDSLTNPDNNTEQDKDVVLNQF